jgi:hypothetical protein
MGAHASIDAKYGAGHILRVRRGQIGDCRRNILRPAEAMGEDLPGERPQRLLARVGDGRG